MKIAVVGTGYIGLSNSVLLSLDDSIQVVCKIKATKVDGQMASCTGHQESGTMCTQLVRG